MQRETPYVFHNIKSFLHRVRSRCVSREDKSLSLGFAEVVMTLVAFMPGPVMYGTIVGKCIIRITCYNNQVIITLYYTTSKIYTLLDACRLTKVVEPSTIIQYVILYYNR